jgi:putative molybdopterin biosynthesis protein
MTENAGTSRREIYLSSIPLADATRIWQDVCDRLDLQHALAVETVRAEDALGRVAAGSVFAAASSPHYHAAAMDGIAVRAVDTSGATPTGPKRLRVGVEATYVNTGEPLPENTDAVIMIEEVATAEEGVLEITAAASPWQHTRAIGEDVVATDVIVPARQRLRPADIGALLAAGVLTVQVARAPRVAIIPTGAEIVSPGEAEKPGQIPDFNSPMIAARLLELGAVPCRRRAVTDTREAIRRAIEAACADVDLVLTIAGASAGARDFTAEALGTAGDLLVHGVAIRPGKPVALGLVGGTPVVALPGYAVSAMLCVELFVAPTVCRLLGVPAPQRPRVLAKLSRKVASHAGSQEYLRVHMGEVAGQLTAVPMARGAGLVGALARADAFVVIPSLTEGYLKGEEVSCELLRPEHEIRSTILITGSHDVALEIRSWEDLLRPDVRFMNRQPGAGTRVLLDYELTRRGLSWQGVMGYGREVFTHLAVASMVETGAADVGLGILAAARARGLDFVPLAEERYDLAVRADVWGSSSGQALRRALESERFRGELELLGGYRASDTAVVQQPPAQ